MSTPSSGSQNQIPDRIARALGQFPPFSLMPEEAVWNLAQRSRVRALAKGESLWKQGEAHQGDLFFLSLGRIEYYWENDGTSELVDVRDVGDLLGLTALLENEPFKVNAVVEEDSLLYVVPGDLFKEQLQDNDSARYYVRRHLFWSTRIGAKVSVPEESRLKGKRTILQSHLEGAQLIQPRALARLLTCLPEAPIKEAAALMVSKRVPSILVVDEERRPLGVVTSVNLVKWVIVQGNDSLDPVRKVMASPVITVAPQSSATAATLLMMRSRVPQVCVTEDGTPESKALDVCTHKDLLAQSGQHPAGLIREIRDARSDSRLSELCDEIEQIARSYVEAGLSGVFLGQICAELYDELTQKLIAMVTAEMGEKGKSLPDVSWAWMSVGSDGRREQVLRTDMDNALVFSSTGDPDLDEKHRKVFLEFADRVIEKLTVCGFTRCQGGVMACNPRWCKTETEWGQEIRSYDFTRGDSTLRAIVLFDLRCVAGDAEMCLRLRELIFDSLAGNLPMQKRLARMIVAVPPPLNFWGQFVVERKGERAGEFDIKSRGLGPLRDAARIYALRYRLMRHYSTGGRFEQLEEFDATHAQVARLAYEAYDFLLRLRIRTGLRRQDSGRFIEPNSLSKLEKSQLTNVFDVLNLLQTSVRMDFQL
ncbi:DUF294 nucleotidyltransferase-like domain-containing protein [Puniceicoccus vermicola]|nr:DUF294 nucleotidyltransferase-like domain-containing protein [Puniceicoccus vermicola]